jgi:hypothetical protein
MGGSALISVLLPTRGRPHSLQESVNSLVDLADDIEQVEILCAVDPDDESAIKVCRELRKVWQVSSFIAPWRYGYGRLHEYFNFLASEATGDWLMLWNDDARMVTEGWDTIITEQQYVPRGITRPSEVLFMDAWYPCSGERGNIFPVWPQWWQHVLGYVSLSPNADVWISELGRRLGVEKRIPVKAVHERVFGVGDETHAEGRGVMGEGNDPGYDSRENRLERARAVRVLQWAGARNGAGA